MKTKKPTQKEIVKRMLVAGEKVSGSSAYKATKRECGIGTLNLHTVLRCLRKDGIHTKFVWCGKGSEMYKEHSLDRSKTSKKLLK